MAGYSVSCARHDQRRCEKKKGHQLVSGSRKEVWKTKMNVLSKLEQDFGEQIPAGL